MKRKTITLLMIGTMLGLTACGNNLGKETLLTDTQTAETDMKEMESVQQTTEENLTTDTEPSEIQNSEDTIEEEKLLVKKITYSTFGNSILSMEEYEYDNGNIVRDFHSSFDANGEVDIKYGHEYDSNGFCIKYNEENRDEFDYTCQNEYEDEKLIKCCRYDNNGNLSKWTEYEYDSNGNEIKQTTYDDDGSLSDWTEYEYDSNGNQLKSTKYYGDETIFDWIEYEYDDNGNMVKEYKYYIDGSLSDWTEYEYNNVGNIIKANTYYEDDYMAWWTEYIYE